MWNGRLCVWKKVMVFVEVLLVWLKMLVVDICFMLFLVRCLNSCWVIGLGVVMLSLGVVWWMRLVSLLMMLVNLSWV